MSASQVTTQKNRLSKRGRMQSTMTYFIALLCASMVLVGCSNPSSEETPIAQGDTYFITNDMVDAIDIMVEEAKVQEGPAKIYNAFIVERTYENELHVLISSLAPSLRFYFDGMELVKNIRYERKDIIKYFGAVKKEAEVTIRSDVFGEHFTEVHVYAPDGYLKANYDAISNNLTIDSKQSTFIPNDSLITQLHSHTQKVAKEDQMIQKLRTLSDTIETYIREHASLVYKKDIDPGFYRSERDHNPKYEQDSEPFKITYTSKGMNMYDSSVNTFEEFVVQSLLFTPSITKSFSSVDEIALTPELMDSFLYSSPHYGACLYENETYKCSDGAGSFVTLPKGMREQKEGYFMVVKEEDYVNTIRRVLGEQAVAQIDISKINGLVYDPAAKLMLMELWAGDVAIPDIPRFVVESVERSEKLIKLVGIKYSYFNNNAASTYLQDKDGNLYAFRLSEYRTIMESDGDFEKWEFVVEDRGEEYYQVISGRILNE